MKDLKKKAEAVRLGITNKEQAIYDVHDLMHDLAKECEGATLASVGEPRVTLKDAMSAAEQAKLYRMGEDAMSAAEQAKLYRMGEGRMARQDSAADENDSRVGVYAPGKKEHRIRPKHFEESVHYARRDEAEELIRREERHEAAIGFCYTAVAELAGLLDWSQLSAIERHVWRLQYEQVSMAFHHGTSPGSNKNVPLDWQTFLTAVQTVSGWHDAEYAATTDAMLTAWWG